MERDTMRALLAAAQLSPRQANGVVHEAAA
jgi:hypothetical protein